MEGRVVETACHTVDFPAVESKLREWEEVEAVGSLRKKQNNNRDITTVFITFYPGHSTQEVLSKLATVKELIMQESKTEKRRATNRGNQIYKDITTELLGSAAHDAHANHERNPAPQDRTPHRNKRSKTQPSNEDSHTAPSNYYRGRDRGFAKAQINTQNVDAQPRVNRRHYERLPPLEANVAFVDNIPFGTTNDQLMDLFSPYGRVLDINRLDLMAMVCYDNPESVQACIQHVNGTKIHDNIISVSSGTVLIPGNIARVLGL